MDGYAPCTQGNCAQHKCIPVTEFSINITPNTGIQWNKDLYVSEGTVYSNCKNKKMELYVDNETKFTT